MTDFFDADLDVPVTKPAVTDKAVKNLQFIYDKSAEGSALDKINVVCNLDYWNTESTPFIIETVQALDMTGTEFFDGMGSTAAELKNILKAHLLASGEINAADDWN